jgi:uncharacterized membrane protein YqjE
MAIFDSVRQLLATVSGIFHTRLELAAVEVEEELERFSSILLRSLAVLFFIGCTIVLLVILLLAIFWDTHRIELICALILLFGLTAGILGWSVRQQVRSRPRLLSQTLAELEKDISALKPAASADSPSAEN